MHFHDGETAILQFIVRESNHMTLQDVFAVKFLENLLGLRQIDVANSEVDPLAFQIHVFLVSSLRRLHRVADFVRHGARRLPRHVPVEFH